MLGRMQTRVKLRAHSTIVCRRCSPWSPRNAGDRVASSRITCVSCLFSTMCTWNFICTLVRRTCAHGMRGIRKIIFLYMSTLGIWCGCRFVENIMWFIFLLIPHCTSTFLWFQHLKEALQQATDSGSVHTQNAYIFIFLKQGIMPVLIPSQTEDQTESAQAPRSE